jgi:hypothetical protein
MPEANDGLCASHGMREEGMFPRNKKSVGAVIAFAMVLAMVLTVPAGAAGWPVWGEAPTWAGQFLPRALAWLGFVKATETCDHGSSIDPNGGCLKSTAKQGPSIDPNGSSSPAKAQGAHIDPNSVSVKDAWVSMEQGSSIDPNG